MREDGRILSAMSTSLSLSLELAEDIISFRLGNCGPSDDPDKQYAYSRSFEDVAVRFAAAVKRIGDPVLSESINSIDLDTQGYCVGAHRLRAELVAVIDQLKELSSDPSYAENAFNRAAFLNPQAITDLRAITSAAFDVRKLLRMCEELNDAYARANYISSALLIRTVLNHIPPVFGMSTFAEVVAQAPRSTKAILKRLDDEARPIADLHAHIPIRKSESLPTINQIEPFKAPFEVLIQEVITMLT